MFFHNFKYALKLLFRDRALLFWTFAFPIILGTFFNLAFSDIEKSERMDIIDIAVVENESFQNSAVWKESFAALSEAESEEQLFHTQYVSEEEAKELLAEKEISGYFLLNEEEPRVVVASSGMQETVLKYVTEEIAQTAEIVQDVAEYQLAENPALLADPEAFYSQLYSDVLEMTQSEETGIRNVSGKNLSYTMVEFYTLIAMTCLYGGLLGMVAVNRNLANMSHYGKRMSVSPMRKGSMLFGSVLASYLTQLVGVVLLFLYTIFVLKVDYGDNLPLIVLLALCGSLAGLTMGIAIAVLVKSNENLKTGIVISVTMVGCFLSGMMGITMKYVIDKNVPILNQLNPANMITDGLYALYYYDTTDRYWFNVVSLLIFSGILLVISLFGLRRQKYDSI